MRSTSAALVSAGLTLVACGGAAVRPTANTYAPVQFAGVHYPVAAALPSADAPGEPPPAQPFDDGDDPRDLGNAALRDQEQLTLVRRYFQLAEAIFDVSRTGVGDEDRAPADYDPVPIARLHATRMAEFATLARRAGDLADRWRQLAAEMAIPLDGDTDGASRAGRLRLFHQLASCMTADTGDRTHHGMAYLDTLRAGGTDDAFRHARPASQRHAEDLRLLARTMTCTRTATRTFR